RGPASEDPGRSRAGEEREGGPRAHLFSGNHRHDPGRTLDRRAQALLGTAIRSTGSLPGPHRPQASRSITIPNAAFAIERMLKASPARVFAAYATLEARSAWFKAPADIETLNRDFDFRVGGKERFHARWPSGMVSDFQATYHDIVENERIILAYD